jgi:Na+-driven multidrug efflux pump
MLWAALNQGITFLILAFYFSTLYISLKTYLGEEEFVVPYNTEQKTVKSSSVLQLCVFIYVLLVGALILFSMTYKNNHPKAQPVYYTIATVLGIYMLISFVFMAYGIYEIIISDPAQENDSTPVYLTREFVLSSLFIVIAGHG